MRRVSMASPVHSRSTPSFDPSKPSAECRAEENPEWFPVATPFDAQTALRLKAKVDRAIFHRKLEPRGSGGFLQCRVQHHHGIGAHV